MNGDCVYRVVMVRHGESEWNQNNLFCGWYDAELSKQGKQQAMQIGETLKSEGFAFDVAFASRLTRAQQSLEIITKNLNQDQEITVETHWRLNERHYGSLTGFNKAQTAQKFGLKQVQIWRRSFDIPPPQMEDDHQYFAAITNNPKFKDVPIHEFPRTESLKSTMQRVIPYWNEVVLPTVREGKRVLIVGHGTSLRALVKYLDKMSDKEIMELNLPTGIPFIYEFDSAFNTTTSLKFLCDEKEVLEAMAKVASIGT